MLSELLGLSDAAMGTLRDDRSALYNAPGALATRLKSQGACPGRQSDLRTPLYLLNEVEQGVMKMKPYASAVVAFAALSAFTATPSLAVDFEYFKSQSCAELGKELDALQKAEKAVNEGIQKKENKANTQAVVTALLIGWPFWGSTDHGDATNQLAEIRTDLRFVTRAQKANKCS